MQVIGMLEMEARVSHLHWSASLLPDAVLHLSQLVEDQKVVLPQVSPMKLNASLTDTRGLEKSANGRVLLIFYVSSDLGCCLVENYNRPAVLCGFLSRLARCIRATTSLSVLRSR